VNGIPVQARPGILGQRNNKSPIYSKKVVGPIYENFLILYYILIN
jgi:hypothetical protein